MSIDPVLCAEIDLAGNRGAFKLGDAGNLPHLANRENGGIDIDQVGAAAIGHGVAP